MIYKIKVKQISEQVVEVQAPTLIVAYARVEKQYKHGDILMDEGTCRVEYERVKPKTIGEALYLNVAPTNPSPPCKPHKVRLSGHQTSARASRSSSL